MVVGWFTGENGAQRAQVKSISSSDESRHWIASCMRVCTRRSAVFRNVYDYRANGGNRFNRRGSCGLLPRSRSWRLRSRRHSRRRRRRRQGRGRAELGCTSQPQLFQVPTQLRGSCGVQSSSSRGSHSGGSTSQKRHSPRTRPGQNASEVPLQSGCKGRGRRASVARQSERRPGCATFCCGVPVSAPPLLCDANTHLHSLCLAGASGEGRFRQAAAFGNTTREHISHHEGCRLASPIAVHFALLHASTTAPSAWRQAIASLPLSGRKSSASQASGLFSSGRS